MERGNDFGIPVVGVVRVCVHIDYTRVYFAVFQFWQSKTDLYSRRSGGGSVQ